MKAHLKRLSMPKSWDVERKTNTFIIRPFPGGIGQNLVMPLQVIIRDVLGFAKTTRDVRYILNNKHIRVNGTRRTEPKYPVGFMDVVEIPDEKLAFRLLIDRHGILTLLETPHHEAHRKLIRIANKTSLPSGGTQLNGNDGTNIVVTKDTFHTHDVLLYDTEKKKILEHVPFEKKTLVYLTGGKNVGDIGTIQDVTARTVLVKSRSGALYETAKEYAFAIGTEKPLITVAEP